MRSVLLRAMELPRYVRKTPSSLRFFLRKKVAYSIYPYIFLPESIYENLHSENPEITFQALLVHEEEHRREQKKGPFKFALQYIFSTSFRRDEELKAVNAAIQYLKGKGISVDLSQKREPYDPRFLFLYPISEILSAEQLAYLVKH